jgi:hypothetical protein
MMCEQRRKNIEADGEEVSEMPKYVIERDAPGVGAMPPRDQKAAVIKAKRVFHELGPDIHWQNSYITDDKIYCVFVAADEEILHEDARLRELPITRVSEVKATLEPATAEIQISDEAATA